MNISTTNLQLPLSSKLTDLIKEALKGKDFNNKTSVILNFSNPNYSSEKIRKTTSGLLNISELPENDRDDDVQSNKKN